MGIVLFVQQHDGKLQKSSLSALTAASSLKAAWKLPSITAVVLGKDAKQVASELSGYEVDKIFFSENGIFENYLAAPYADTLTGIVKEVSATAVVMASTSTGKDVAARVAGLLDAGQASDILAVNDDGTLKRPMYAGNVFAEVEISTAMKVVTVRATAFPPAEKKGGAASVHEVSTVPSSKGGAEIVGYEIAKAERPELSDAPIVVSGGRALGSAENFQKVLFPLADTLGAAVGASRAAVDSGYAPNDWQVGQTGKVVAPNLYIGVGLSGAIQHLAGMKDSKVIVAINKDPDAPIFEVADYGLVADLFVAVPELIEEIKKAKS